MSHIPTTEPPEWCRVYWGSHGCQYDRGHEGPHECDCCDCLPDHESAHELNGCVAKPPYYGPDTQFYGDDAVYGEGSEEDKPT